MRRLPGMSKLERLEQEYRAHHERSRPSTFIFGGAERSEPIARRVGSGVRVLDLGCRSGALTSHYLAGNAIVGVDVDREALAEAAKLGIETLFADLDEALPFADASFDVVIVAEILEHLQFPARLVEEAARVLRPGGRIVGSVPNGYRLKSRLEFLLGGPPDRDPTHLQLFAPDHVRRLFPGWVEVELEFVAGRLVPLNGPLFANDIVFSARRPG